MADLSAALASGIAALAVGVSASREMIGKPDVVPANGYATVCFGRHVFELPYPIALRSLFPLLLGPKRVREQVIVDRDSQRCRNYQMLRIAFAWASFWLLCAAFGPVLMATVAALFILTLRFDYWSNFVELLAASIVLSASRLGIPMLAQVGSGLVLGLGRETLPMLALVPGGVPLAIGSAVSQGAVRLLRRENPDNERFAKAIEYGTCKLKSYCWLGVTDAPWEAVPRILLYLSIAVLAALSVPFAAIGMVAITCMGSRIDEPRVLTQLIPWASMVLVGAHV